MELITIFSVGTAPVSAVVVFVVVACCVSSISMGVVYLWVLRFYELARILKKIILHVWGLLVVGSDESKY